MDSAMDFGLFIRAEATHSNHQVKRRNKNKIDPENCRSVLIIQRMFEKVSFQETMLAINVEEKSSQIVEWL